MLQRLPRWKTLGGCSLLNQQLHAFRKRSSLSAFAVTDTVAGAGVSPANQLSIPERLSYRFLIFNYPGHLLKIPQP